MADQILASVAARRDLIEGGEHVERLHRVISRYATAALYTRQPSVLAKLQAEILRYCSRKFFPLARNVGHEAAQPILDRLTLAGGKRAARLRAAAMRGLRRATAHDILVLRRKLEMAANGLKDATNVAFAEAADPANRVARQELIRKLNRANRAEMAAKAKAARRIDGAAKGLQKAEKGLARQPRNRKMKVRVTKARKELTAAKRSHRTAKSMMGRFETAVQGDVRDAVRRQCYEAQMAAYREKGFGPKSTYSWIAVNGAGACPGCSAMHGETRTLDDWSGMDPKDGLNECGGSCMCELVPATYAEGNPTLVNPLTYGREVA